MLFFRLKTKLRSARGASITFALLLFMVCAVVGSVVLTAGSASAGRVSELAEMDQRYYAVTSAAELFRDALNGKRFPVVREHTETVHKAFASKAVYDSGGDPMSAPETTELTVFSMGGKPLNEISPITFKTAPGESVTEDLLSSIVLDIVFGTNRDTSLNTVEYAVGFVPFSLLPYGEDNPLALTLTDPGGYKVKVTGIMREIGDDAAALDLTFENDDGGQSYSLGFTLTFRSEGDTGKLTTSYSPIVSPLTVTDPDTGAETVQVHETTKTETKWNLTGVTSASEISTPKEGTP